MSQLDQSLRLQDKAIVFIDWANVHGWEHSLKKPVSPLKLYRYVKMYEEIKSIKFYFGTDNHPKAKAFLTRVKKIGFVLVTKPVKYITVNQSPLIRKRKCDFDIEITMDVYAALAQSYQTFIFFSGDGDFSPLYQYLIKLRKQVLVVYARGHIGREIWEIKRGLFKIQIQHLLKNSSP